MKRTLLGMLLVALTLCASVATPAFGDDAEPSAAHGTESSAAVAESNAAIAESNAAAGNESGSSHDAEQPPAVDIFSLIRDAVVPVLKIDKDALFRNQYDWEAVDTVNFDSANEDGSLSEWQMDWYISHDWSEYGYVIARLEPGDAVTVNGRTILILGREIWPAGSINWDIFDAIGWDKVVFQTCLGDESIWIAYGIPVYPTKEFLAAHPPQWAMEG